MIEILPESAGNLLAIKATEKLTDKDYKEVMIPHLESIIREHGKARFVMDLSEDFHGWELTAMWDDAHFGLTHRNDFERMGIVGGPRCAEWGTKVAQVLMGGEIKCFPAGQRDEALAWVKASVAEHC